MTTQAHQSTADRESAGLWRAAFEKDSCGFGLIANMDDRASHSLVSRAIEALSRLTHRGAVAADGRSGDGCGLLIRRPDSFLRAVAADAGIQCGELFATGNVFLAHDGEASERARKALADAVADSGLSLAGWRELPLDPEV